MPVFQDVHHAEGEVFLSTRVFNKSWIIFAFRLTQSVLQCQVGTREQRRTVSAASVCNALLPAKATTAWLKKGAHVFNCNTRGQYGRFPGAGQGPMRVGLRLKITCS